MDNFDTIRLKKKTIEKLKIFSKKISPSYSETLDFMIAFFEDNNLSPYDTLNMSYTTLLNKFNKRMDAVVSIFRNIEETQLKPTKEMLESLFEGNKKEKKQVLLVERKFKEQEKVKSKEESLNSHYYNRYEATNKELNQLKRDLKYTLFNAKYMKSTFGTDYYRLNLTKEEFEKLNSKLKL
jgi:hypothetical protein